jgi:uncharacterized protein YutE (UPF0331/DUF86 family)
VVFDNDVILLRLNLIKRCYKKIKLILDKTLDQFLKDDISQLAIERCLQLSAQAMADIGSHLIAQSGWAVPNTYSEIISVLSNKKILSKSLANKIESFMGLRNILVHSYLEIDEELLYNEIKENVEELLNFNKAIEHFLEIKS